MAGKKLNKKTAKRNKKKPAVAKKEKKNKKKKVVKKEIAVKTEIEKENENNLKCINLIKIIKKQKTEEESNKAFEKLLPMLMPKIHKVISRFNIPGYDSSDIMQEALYALRYKAIKDYDKSRGTGEGPAPFDKFALLCIRRHLATEFKSSYQNKKRVLNHSLSIDKESHNNSTGEDLSLSSIISDPNSTDVITSVGEKEYYRNLQTLLLNSLSDFEKEVYFLYVQKNSYEEMAEKINKDRSKIRVNIKGVDNSLSRIKKKAQEILENYESKE